MSAKWECGDCGRPETGGHHLDHVCHHCGLLLCRECCTVVIDGAFGGPMVAADRAASHCRVCRRRYHSLGISLGTGPG